MYNPLHIAGAHRRSGAPSANMPNRRRARVGAEFKYCADGSQVQFDEQCPPGNGITYVGPGPIVPGGRIPITDLVVPGGWNPPRWTNTPSGGGGGGGGGGGTPPTTSTIPSGGGTPSGGGYPSGGGNPVLIPTGPGCPPQVCQPPLNVCPENQKRWTLPFVPDTGFTATVAAGAQVRFVAFPQGLFIGERLIVPSTIGPFFDIVDFRIANKPQTMAAGNVPADMYSEVSTLDTMKYDQAYPGIQVVLTALNKSSVTQTFQCSLSGWAVG